MIHSPQNTYEPGCLLFKCTPRRLKDYILDAERSQITYFGNLLLFVVPALFLSGFVLHLAGIDGPLSEHPVCLTLFWGAIAAGFITGFWWFYRAPLKDYLVVYENGFQWRTWLGKWNTFRDCGSVFFGDLEKIVFRPDWDIIDDPKAEKNNEKAIGNFVINLFFPKGDLRLVLKNGKTKTIENLMKRFERNDLKKFIHHLIQNHPQLIENMKD